MAQSQNSFWCLDKIQQKDTHLTLTAVIDIMETININK